MSFNIWKYGCAAIVAAAVVAGMASAPAPALADEHSYKGEELTVIIRSNPGGGYDFYGRLMSRHMPKYLPGNPEAIVQHMSVPAVSSPPTTCSTVPIATAPRLPSSRAISPLPSGSVPMAYGTTPPS